MKKTFLLIMLSILLIPCFVKAEEVNNNTEITEEDITENRESNINEDSTNIEDNAEDTNDNENNTLNEDENTTENNTNTEENTNNQNSTDTSLIPNATAGILMDATTGEIIFEKNKDEQVAVASMTKMVAQIIILEQIEAGKIKWTDKVTASANASGMGGSQIYLTTGEEMTVEDMMKGISMASANDVAVTKKQSLVISEEIII